MLVGDCGDDAGGDEEEGAEAESEEEAVPGEVDWVAGGVLVASYIRIEKKRKRKIERGRKTNYSTTKIPIAVMLTNVAKYHHIGASLYLLISRLCTSS